MKTVSAALAAIAGLALAAPAQAHKGTTSFQGSCRFRATVQFVPALTALPGPGSAVARGQGTCSGSAQDPRARYVAWNRGTASCQGGLAEGGGYLVIDGKRLSFGLTERRVGAVAELQLRGARGGSARAIARVSPETDPSQVVTQCSGAGLERAEVDIDLITTGPSISG